MHSQRAKVPMTAGISSIRMRESSRRTQTNCPVTASNKSRTHAPHPGRRGLCRRRYLSAGPIGLCSPRNLQRRASAKVDMGPRTFPHLHRTVLTLVLLASQLSGAAQLCQATEMAAMRGMAGDLAHVVTSQAAGTPVASDAQCCVPESVRAICVSRADAAAPVASGNSLSTSKPGVAATCSLSVRFSEPSQRDRLASSSEPPPHPPFLVLFGRYLI